MTGRPPIIVLEGSAGSSAREAVVLAERGFALVDGFAPRNHRTGTAVCRGIVRTEADASAAILAVLAGYGLLAEAAGDRALVDRLLVDLRHLSPSVEHRIVDAQDSASLDPEARSLLALLSQGLTLGQAAASLGMARRTADRRLAGARRGLGTERTTEAITRARRLGWIR